MRDWAPAGSGGAGRAPAGSDAARHPGHGSAPQRCSLRGADPRSGLAQAESFFFAVSKTIQAPKAMMAIITSTRRASIPALMR